MIPIWDISKGNLTGNCNVFYCGVDLLDVPGSMIRVVGSSAEHAIRVMNSRATLRLDSVAIYAPLLRSRVM